MSDLSGQTFGQYQIIGPIGAGGMGAVYKAHQVDLGRDVALKILPAQHALTPGFKERFLFEAKAVAQLSHPNILPIYEVGLEGDISWFAMKYIPSGRTLKDVMKPLLPLPQVAHFISQAAAALDHAHQHGILHRDIKPANMLLEDDWLQLADFGLAKMMTGDTGLTGTGVVIGGTPAYVSPEQGRGVSVDHHTDIYSLGIVLYELVTGQTPYQAETPMGLIIKHIMEPLPPPRQLRPDLPEAVEQAIIKALAKDPNERYHQASELAEALRQAVSNHNSEIVTPVNNSLPVIAASPPPPPTTPQVEMRRGMQIPKTWLLAGGGLVVGLLLLVTVAGLIFLAIGKSNLVSGVTTPTMQVLPALNTPSPAPTFTPSPTPPAEEKSLVTPVTSPTKSEPDKSTPTATAPAPVSSAGDSLGATSEVTPTSIFFAAPQIIERNETQQLGPISSHTGEHSLEVTLKEFEWRQEVRGNEARPGHIFVVAHLQLKNLGPGNGWNASGNHFMALDANGVLNVGIAYMTPSECQFNATLMAGGTTKGCVGIEVPASGKVDLIFSPFWNDKNLILKPGNYLSFNLRTEGETIPTAPTPTPSSTYIERNETQQLGPLSSYDGEHSWEVTLKGYEWAQGIGSSVEPRPGYLFVIAHLRIKNLGPDSSSISVFDFMALEANTIIDNSFAYAISPTACRLEDTQLTASGTIEGCVGLEVPAEGKLDLIYAPLTLSMEPELKPGEYLSFNLRPEDEAVATVATPTLAPTVSIPATSQSDYIERNETYQIGPISIPNDDNEYSYEITLEGIEWPRFIDKTEPRAGYVFLVAYVKITNLGPTDSEEGAGYLMALDANGVLGGNVQSPADCALYPANHLPPTVRVGGVIEGCMGLEVPAEGKVDLIYAPLYDVAMNPELKPGSYITFNVRP